MFSSSVLWCLVLCETVSCVVHALPAEAEEESASASASQVLLFFVFCGRSSAAASNIKRSNGGGWFEQLLATFLKQMTNGDRHIMYHIQVALCTDKLSTWYRAFLLLA